MAEKKITLKSLDARVKGLEGEIRKIGMLLERLDGKFGMLYEVHLAHEKRFNELDNRIEGIERRMDSLEKKLDDGIEFIVQKLDQKLDREEFLTFRQQMLPAN